MRLFYLSQRANGGVWYVALRDESGIVGTRKSTHTTSKKEAEAIALTWLRDGMPQTQKASNQSFCEFLACFWDFDSSPYFKELLTIGKGGHRRHALDMQKNIRCYFIPYFGQTKLRQIDEETLQDFLIYLKTQKGLAASTVNKARNAAFVAIRYAKRRKLILSFDFEAVLRAGGKPKERGILEREEMEALFYVPWRDERSRLVNLMASQTGMRMGEIQALCVCDILIDRIRVSHSWSPIDGGLKCPKNGEMREIPLSQMLKEELQKYMESSKTLVNTRSLLFQGLKDGVPFDNKQIHEDFYKAMADIGINKEERLQRNIVFHLDADPASALMLRFYPVFFDLKITAPNGAVTFEWNNVHISNGLWSASNDLPSHGNTGIPTIKSFMLDSIRKTMSADTLYQKAKDEALSDPIFLGSILFKMTELNRQDFITKELSTRDLAFTLNIIDAKQNKGALADKYKYVLTLSAKTMTAPWHTTYENLMFHYYTNREDVVSFSIGTPIKASGKIIGIEQIGLTYMISLVE